MSTLRATLPRVPVLSRMNELAKVRFRDTIPNTVNPSQALQRAVTEISQPIKAVVHGYGRLHRRLRPFDATLAELTLKHREEKGAKRLEHVLEELNSARKEVIKLGKQVLDECESISVPTAGGHSQQRDQRRLAVNRGFVRLQTTLSLLVAPPLREITAIQHALWRLPCISSTAPTAVFVGCPNVGKSSLVRAVSTGKPLVSNFPFTTRGVTVGHFFVQPEEGSEVSCQVMDTPGLLSRGTLTQHSQTHANAMAQQNGTNNNTHTVTFLSSLQSNIVDSEAITEEEDLLHELNALQDSAEQGAQKQSALDMSSLNMMELLTIRSVELLPSIIVFVIDLAGHAGEQSNAPAQFAVRKALRSLFPDRTWIDVVSKCDMPKAAQWPVPSDLNDAILVSATGGTGIAKLQDTLSSAALRMVAAQKLQEQNQKLVDTTQDTKRPQPQS